jgi:hypothetical protein
MFNNSLDDVVVLEGGTIRVFIKGFGLHEDKLDF